MVNRKSGGHSLQSPVDRHRSSLIIQKYDPEMIEENKIAEKFKNQIVFLKDFDG